MIANCIAGDLAVPAICSRAWLTAYRRVNIITAIPEAHVIE